MKVQEFAITKGVNDRPFVMTLWNTGCGSRGCHCSDGWILSVSNGSVGLTVHFEDEREMKKYLYKNSREEK